MISAALSLFNTSLSIKGLLNALDAYLFRRTYGKPWITIIFILTSIGAMDACVFSLE